MVCILQELVQGSFFLKGLLLARCNNSIILLRTYKPILSGGKKNIYIYISGRLFQSEGIKVANSVLAGFYSEDMVFYIFFFF